MQPYKVYKNADIELYLYTIFRDFSKIENYYREKDIYKLLFAKQLNNTSTLQSNVIVDVHLSYIIE